MTQFSSLFYPSKDKVLIHHWEKKIEITTAVRWTTQRDVTKKNISLFLLAYHCNKSPHLVVVLQNRIFSLQNSISENSECKLKTCIQKSFFCSVTRLPVLPNDVPIRRQIPQRKGESSQAWNFFPFNLNKWLGLVKNWHKTWEPHAWCCALLHTIPPKLRY